MKKIFVTLSALLVCMATFAQFGTVYLGPGGTLTITSDQGIGDNYVGDRSSNPAFFVGVGAANFVAGVAPDDGHNINGYQKHIPDAANQAYDFYVGSGTDLRKLSVSGTIPANAEIATAWIVGNPTTVQDPTNSNATHDTTKVGTGIKAVSGKGQWDWMDVNNVAAGTTVSVSIPSLGGFSLAANLRLVGWDGSNWINLGTAGAADTTENSTLTGTIPSGVTLQALAVGTTQVLAGSIDLTPRVTVSPSVLHGAAQITLTANVFNLSSASSTSGLISLYLTKDAALFGTTTFDAAANPGWTFDNTNPDYYIFTTNDIIAADGAKKVTLKVAVASGSTNGDVPVTATLLPASGGDSNASNDSDDDILTYYKN